MCCWRSNISKAWEILTSVFKNICVVTFTSRNRRTFCNATNCFYLKWLLGNGASWVLNFCARFTDIILQGNHWCVWEMSATFLGHGVILKCRVSNKNLHLLWGKKFSLLFSTKFNYGQSTGFNNSNYYNDFARKRRDFAFELPKNPVHKLIDF